MASQRTNGIRFAAVVVLPFIILVLAAAVGQRARFEAKFSPGETLRYNIESHTATAAKTTAPIANPEGGSQSNQLIHLVMRLDVLDPPHVAGAAAARLRATCEKSTARSETDAFDPAAPSLEDQYAGIEGHAFEFTIKPDGQFADFQGLDSFAPDRSAAESVVAWLEFVSSRSGYPRNGISIGQKWQGQRPLAEAPLSGLTWSTESTYLRNEPCSSSGRGDANAAPGKAKGEGDECAVILTRFKISRHGSAHSDATPQDYLRNGLRTSGTWTGSGESLDTISLASGLLVSSTQSSTQDMDYEVTSASTGSSIHHVGKVQSQSEIALLPATQ
ncbi:MAG TPA: hypothetical protein VJO53_12760 [Candidatus Acidoferrales bacterium]|nr:hypothetical protein [Candidatus Acidoferrales bacterium]